MRGVEGDGHYDREPVERQQESPVRSDAADRLGRATKEQDFVGGLLERATANVEGLRCEAVKDERTLLEKLIETIKSQLESDPATRNLSGETKAQILEWAIERVLGNRTQDWFNVDGAWSLPDMMSPDAGEAFQHGVIGGAISLGLNYVQMRIANTRGSDKYYHCMAHCQAASQGAGGRLASKIASSAREQSDLVRNVQEKGMTAVESLSDCLIDTWANERGNATGRSGERCSTGCGPFKVKGL